MSSSRSIGSTTRPLSARSPSTPPIPTGRLVDRFHADHVYLIGVREGKVIAMMAVRRRRPFSLDAKIPDLDRWLPAGLRPVEIRLFAVLPAYRNGPVPAQLLQFIARHCLDLGDDLGIISGAVSRMSLYRALGFESFGPRVGTPEAPYQPMMQTLASYLKVVDARRSLQGAFRGAPATIVNLLPGPVAA